MGAKDDRDHADHRKGLILDAVVRLLETTSFDQLTVTAICDEAGVSRPTFYHYFKDKFEVTQWFWDRAGEHYLHECGRSLGWYESNLGMLREFAAHARFFAKALAETGDANSCIRHGYRRRVAYLREVIAETDPLLLTDDLEFQIAFFTDAESRAISAWMLAGMAERPEVLARHIEACVPRELHDLVEAAHRRATGAAGT